jgi:hypothetical protein
MKSKEDWHVGSLSIFARGEKRGVPAKQKVWFFLERQCHEIFDFRFVHESVAPSPRVSLFLGPFRFFSKIRGDISSSMCTTGVVDTGGTP